MSTSAIKISANGGPVTAKVSCPRFPQTIVGVIWRYNPDETFDFRCGTFQTDSQIVSLGTVTDTDGKLFLIEGAVLNQNDNPPTPYEIVVEIFQDGNLLNTEVPTDGGKGNIGDKDIAFVYHFTLNT